MLKLFRQEVIRFRGHVINQLDWRKARYGRIATGVELLTSRCVRLLSLREVRGIPQLKLAAFGSGAMFGGLPISRKGNYIALFDDGAGRIVSGSEIEFVRAKKCVGTDSR